MRTNGTDVDCVLHKHTRGRPCVLLAGQEGSSLSLEGDDDDGEFDVSLLLQLSQNSGPEEHLTLTNTEQVGIQIQVLHLEDRKREKNAES